jgi:hypothetical protein
VEQVLVKAFVPRDLKRRAFGRLALQEESFSAWLREQLESFVEQAEQEIQPQPQAPQPQEVPCAAATE